MDLLADDSSPELTSKEIMRQWEQRGKTALVPTTAPGSSPRNPSGASSRKDQRNAPQITQADNNLQAWQGESSVRHVGGGHNYAPSSTHNTPPQAAYDLGTPNLPYSHGPAPGSTESHRTGSPHRHSYRSPAIQKQPLGTAGAG
jgi:hypothetical protein